MSKKIPNMYRYIKIDKNVFEAEFLFISLIQFVEVRGLTYKLTLQCAFSVSVPIEDDFVGAILENRKLVLS